MRFGWLGVLLAAAAILTTTQTANAEEYYDQHGNYWDSAWQAWRDPVSWWVWDNRSQTWKDPKTWNNGWPTPAQPRAVASAGGGGSVRSWLAAAGWSGGQLEQAYRVVTGTWNCPNGESTGNPNARNGTYLGLFQLHPMHFAPAGYSSSQWADPVVNAAVALHLFRSSGWGPWECKP